ncbi:MAG: hypothetical protein ACE5O2_04195, partial [Armatimonadota bacterium]
MAILLSAARVAGSVADMRALVSSRPELMHQWTFEGRFVRECMTDKRAGLRLREVAYPARKGAEPNLHEYGPDKTSRCLRIIRQGEKEGRAAETVGPVRFQREGTLELLFRADDIPPGEFNKGWMLHTSAGNRLYLAGVSRFRDVAEVIAGFGTAQPFHPKAEVVIAWLGGRPSFAPGRWHYLAVTYSHDLRNGQFTINAYVAPIGVQGASLAHAVKDARRAGDRAPLGDRVIHLGSAGASGQILDG